MPENLNIFLNQAELDKNPNSIDLTKLKKVLNNHGVILVRGYDFNLESYEKLTRFFCADFHMVAARHAFKSKEGDNYSTEVVPLNFTLLSHTEGTFQPLAKTIPDLCFFYCVTAPIYKGGETTILDGKIFLENMPSNIREKFEKFGITYEMLWEKTRWQNEFGFETILQLKEFLQKAKNVKYSINENEELNLFFTTQAITQASDGSQVFAPGMLAHLPSLNHPSYINKKVYTKQSNKVYFGNGEQISDEIINSLIDIQDKFQHLHKWQDKDIIIIDNSRFLHGRTETEKECARTLVSRFGIFASH
jgi:alpha-ketoglutarate-dependent taurine dioxygenase